MPGCRTTTAGSPVLDRKRTIFPNVIPLAISPLVERTQYDPYLFEARCFQAQRNEKRGPLHWSHSHRRRLPIAGGGNCRQWPRPRWRRFPAANQLGQYSLNIPQLFEKIFQ